MRTLTRPLTSTFVACVIALGTTSGSAQDAGSLQAPPLPAITPNTAPQYPLPPQVQFSPGSALPQTTPSPALPASDPPLVNITPQTNPNYAAGAGSWTPGGFENRVGRPYYYSAYGMDASTMGSSAYMGQGMTGGYPAFGAGNCGCAGAMGFGRMGFAGPPMGEMMPQPAMGAGIAGGNFGGDDLYTTHFGAGYHRNTVQGHYRFPYYSYRRPWYFQGPPSYNRDTNLAW